MREIKFRFWDKDSKMMIHIDHEYFITLGGGVYANNFKSYESQSETVDIDNFLNEKHGELMQYTCLKDKNGVEIYEGDIIKVPELLTGDYTTKEWVGQVKYEAGCFGVIKEFKEPWKVNYEDIDTAGLEVIGNIYEAPELLEE